MISLIIPMYNSEKTIANTLQSVINQTVTFTEVIVVDNGSSDQSANIVSEICKQHPNIHLFTCQEKGVSAARNMGILQSKSPYIGFLDADDILEDNYVQLLKESIDQYPLADMHYFNFQQEFKSGIIRPNQYFLHNQSIYDGEAFMKQSLRHFSFEAKHMVWSFIFKTSFLNQNHLRFNHDVPIFEDILFLHTVWQAKPIIIVVDKCLVTYKYTETSITQQKQKQLSVTNVFSLLIKQLKSQEQQKYLKQLASRVLQLQEYLVLFEATASYKRATISIQYYLNKILYMKFRMFKKVEYLLGKR